MNSRDRGPAGPHASRPKGPHYSSPLSGDRLYSLGQLILARVREFTREPEAVFWAVFFPVLLTTALGIAFGGSSIPALPVVTSSAVDARAHLEPTHRSAYAEYDRLAKKDRDAPKSARLEKIVGAIQNNLEQIPELKERLKELVKEWK